LREIVFAVAALAAIAATAATVAIFVFLMPPKAAAADSDGPARISPLAIHLKLDVRRLPVSQAVDYTYVFPVL
jgi:hypothetical protein